jgi:predicted transcriptional regulator
MAIYRLLEGSSFDPETIRVMTTAYEDARRILGLKDRSDLITQALASKIIEVAKRDDRDPAAVRDRALAALGKPLPSS